jgi:hypothetical protein
LSFSGLFNVMKPMESSSKKIMLLKSKSNRSNIKKEYHRLLAQDQSRLEEMEILIH